MEITRKELRTLITESFGGGMGEANILRPMKNTKSRAQYLYDWLDKVNETERDDMDPGSAGIAAAGGGTPADRGGAAVQRDAYEARSGGGVDAGPGPAYRFVEEVLPQLLKLRDRANQVGFYDVRDALDQAITATEDFN
jgi:hypothetical protein